MSAAALLYVLLATAAGAPNTIVLAQSHQAERCEAIKAQIEQAPSTGRAYHCETFVAPKGWL